MTFAGSPDRIEARLVPEAGYELDTFRISGLPRRPSPALARALLLAGRAPRACAQILRARRPDVVLGGGGYVAGPMVYAAFRQRVPTALMEADAHLGLANRLAAPFARRVFLSFPIAGREGEKYQVTGRPIPARSRAVPQPEARRVFGLPAEGPVLLVFGGSLGARHCSTRSRSMASAPQGRRCCTSLAPATTTGLPRTCRGRTTGCSPSRKSSARRSERATWFWRGRRIGVGACGSR